MLKNWKEKNKKNVDIDGKVLYRLTNNTVSGKTMENLRNRIDVKVVSNKKEHPKTFKKKIQTKLYVKKKYLAMS